MPELETSQEQNKIAEREQRKTRIKQIIEGAEWGDPHDLFSNKDFRKGFNLGREGAKLAAMMLELPPQEREAFISDATGIIYDARNERLKKLESYKPHLEGESAEESEDNYRFTRLENEQFVKDQVDVILEMLSQLGNLDSEWKGKSLK